MKKVIFRVSIFLLLVLAVVMNTEFVDAKSSYNHQIFSNTVVSKRIKEIQNFYYKKPKQLKTKSQAVILNFKKGKMVYYFHGKDLLLSFGKIKGTEYRAYYLKNQLIRLLVDKSGKRQTYVQYYAKSQSEMMQDYDTALLYFDVENYARKMMENIKAPTLKKSFDGLAVITKIKGNTIWYHKANSWGGDGCILSLEPETFKAQLSKACLIYDDSESPDERHKRTKNWFANRLGVSGVGQICDLTVKNVKAENITIPYMA